MGKESARSSWRAPRDAWRGPPRQGACAGRRSTWCLPAAGPGGGGGGVCRSLPRGPLLYCLLPRPHTSPLGCEPDMWTTLCGARMSARWAARVRPCGAGRVGRTRTGGARLFLSGSLEFSAFLAFGMCDVPGGNRLRQSIIWVIQSQLQRPVGFLPQ